MKDLSKELDLLLKIVALQKISPSNELKKRNKVETQKDHFNSSSKFIEQKLDKWEHLLKAQRESFDQEDNFENQRIILQRMNKTESLIKMIGAFHRSSAYLIKALLEYIGEINKKSREKDILIESLQNRVSLYSDGEDIVINKVAQLLTKKK